MIRVKQIFRVIRMGIQLFKNKRRSEWGIRLERICRDRILGKWEILEKTLVASESSGKNNSGKRSGTEKSWGKSGSSKMLGDGEIFKNNPFRVCSRIRQFLRKEKLN